MEAVDKISVGVSKEKAGQNTQEAITENADGMKVSLGEKSGMDNGSLFPDDILY